MPKATIDRVNVENRRVLMRVDFNVPLEEGRITDDRRIVQSLESVRSVIDRAGKLILMSHLGRPEGKGPEHEFSLRPVTQHLSNLLKRDVRFSGDCVGPEADRIVDGLQPGQVCVLENLRFHAEETLIDKAKKNPDKRPTPQQRERIDAFANSLARHGDLYCNNAFGTCHRQHVSMYDVPMLIGAGRRVCGNLVEKELRFLGEAMTSPKRPFVAILGGAKVSDKIGVIANLLPRVDSILIGGAMTYTFYAAQGLSIGTSLCEQDKVDLAKELLRKAGAKLKLPTDSICANEIKKGAQTATVMGNIPPALMGLDIGPATIAEYRKIMKDARTIVWNGPMGVFETPPFDTGTISIAQALAEATKNGAVTIVGGGDSAAAVEAAGLSDDVTHVSTGGGASLEYLEGKAFPTIDILDEVTA